MSIKHLYEDERPSLLLDFANLKTLDSRITFTRNSTATYVDEMGVIKTAAAGEARFDHSGNGECLGLLVEGESTNTIANQDVTSGYWLKDQLTTAASTITSPDGGTNAYLLTETAQSTGVTALHHIKRNSLAVTPNTYAYSIFAKSNGRNIRLSIQGLGSQSVIFDLSNGVIHPDSLGTTGKIEPFPDGWYRCSLTVTSPDSTQRNANMYIANGSDLDYQGDGTSGVYVCFLQLEISNFPTSYIPTSGSTVTRTADDCQITGTNFSSWYNQDSGTFLVTATPPSGDSFAPFFTTNLSTQSIWKHQIGLWRFQSSNSTAGKKIIAFNIQSVSTTQLELSATSGGEVFTAAVGYGPDFVGSYNGGTAITNTTLREVSPDRLFIGSRTINGASNHIARLAYYNTRLSNTALEALTT